MRANPRHKSDAEKAEIVRRFLAGESKAQIARDFSVNLNYPRRAAIAAGHDVRQTMTPTAAIGSPRCYGTVEERFWSKVSPEPNTGCWLWAGDWNGAYGNIGVRGEGKKQARKLAHRLSYEIHKGPIPTGLEVDHECRVKLCVNPDHLVAKTRRANIMAIPPGHRGNNQISTRCKRGHPFEGANLRFNSDGYAVCRACALIHSRNADARRKAKR